MRVLLLTIAVIVFLYVCLVAVIALNQRNLLYYPQPVDPALASRFQADAIQLDVPGATLRGWFIRHQDPTAPVLIYFGGNGDEASRYLLRFSRLNCCAALLVNYRGYGDSTGEPAETTLRADALAVYDAAQRLRPGPGPTILFGRSLGTGMAIYAAAARPGTPLVLVSPYDSILAVARAAFPFVPVRALLKDPFENTKYADKVAAPALVFLAERDVVIERRRSDALLQSLPGEVETHIVPSTDHNSIGGVDALWQRVDEWSSTHRVERRHND